MKKTLVKNFLSAVLSGLLLFSGLLVVSCEPPVEPDIPTQELGIISNVTMSKVTSQSAEFTWTKPTGWVSFDYVTITLKQGDDFKDELQVYSTDVQRVVFKKLTPDTDYTAEFTSVSYELGRASTPIVKSFKTLAIEDDPSYLPGFSVSVKEGAVSGSGTIDDPYEVVAGGSPISLEFLGVRDYENLSINSSYGSYYNIDIDNFNHTITVDEDCSLESFNVSVVYYDEENDEYNEQRLYFYCLKKINTVRLSVTSNFIDLADAESITVNKQYYDNDGYVINNPYIMEESWASSDETIATVKDGVVTFISEGKVIITYSASGKTASIEVAGYTNLQFPTSVGFAVEEKTVYVGDSFDPEFTMTPETATPLYAISVSDDTVISVGEDKKITALKPGTATVTLTYQTSATAINTDEVTVTVDEKPVAFAIGDSEVKLSITANKTYTIPVTLTPATSKAHNITFTSSSEKVVVSESGIVSFAGSDSDNKVDATISVKVNDLPVQTLDVCYYVPLTGISFDGYYLMMRPNDSVDLSIKYEPENAYVSDLTPEVKHKSEGILEIADGKITAKKAGLDSIRYELGGYTAVLPVIVEKNAKIYDSPVTKTITQGNTDDNQKIAWKYSKELAKYGVLKNYYTGKIDIQANNNGWQQSTANNAGWVWGLNGDILQLENNGGYFTYNGKGTYANDGIELYVTPIIVYRDEIPYVMLVSTLWNDSDEEISDVDLSMGADVYIHSGTNSPLTRTSYGAILMCGNGCGFQYVADLNAYTPVDTVWFGNGPDDVTQHLYDDSGYSKNVQYKSADTAMAFSWQDITLGDDPEVFVVMIGALKDVGGTLEAIIY